MDKLTKAISLGMESYIDEDDGELIYNKVFKMFETEIQVDISFVYSNASVDYIYEEHDRFDPNTGGDYIVTVNQALDVVEKMNELEKLLKD